MNDVVRLALTLGEPAGIGPDICLQLAQHVLPAEVVVVGSPDLLQQRAKLLGLEITLYELGPTPTLNGKGRLAISPISLLAPCVPGTLNVANSAYVLNTLQQAYQLCAHNICQALVTAPVHKAILAQSGATFSGHTEFFAQLAGVQDVLMTFYTPELIVGLVTTHCPLKAVSQKLTSQRLTRSLQLLQEGLINIFKRAHPKIRICGLNPHAGENGLLGDEEIEIMIPVIETLKAQGLDLLGPMSADTAFTATERSKADAILAMYHDQALAPLKALYFNEIVNMTLGLPFLRTSVDHGTALALAGTGQASSKSLQHAINISTQLISEH